MFAQDADPVQIARSLRVSTKSVYQWRRALAGRRAAGPGVERAGRELVPARRGPARAAARRAGGRPGRSRLGPGPALDPGPGRRAGRAPVRSLLHAARDVVPAAPDRLLAAGPGPPGGRAGRGRSRRVAGGDLGQGTRLAALTGAWICFEDEAGQSLRPGKARTWAPRGHTPVTRVSGNSRALVGRGHGLPEAGPAGPVLLPGPRPPPPQGRPGQHVRGRLRRPGHRRAPRPERSGCPRLGQPQHPPQPEDAAVHRGERGLAYRHPACPPTLPT